MQAAAPRIVIIPADPELAKGKAVQRQLRVAAYCRVSTDEEEQLTSYEAQQTYYTDKIMTNPSWTMAGIFADEGITGTSAKKRREFQRMIKLCRQKRIDIILTKSISRFARNTLDCIKYVRELKELGIAVIFEKENINTLESSSEMLLTMLSAFAQAESESISGNVGWGIRHAMREGRTAIHYRSLYGYEKGADGKPEIIPDEAEIVKDVYSRFLAGDSLRMIVDDLNERRIPSRAENGEWNLSAVRRVLTNEIYRGDVIRQKTFTVDCISKKVMKNTGQREMVLIENNHEAIIDRRTFDAVQTELARRTAGRSPSKKNAPTGRSCYSAKYALSERLVCGECGTMYQRCTWTKGGTKRIVWRCVSRVEYGSRYCHSSPTLDEAPLQKSIIAALNSVMTDKAELIRLITEAAEMELSPLPGGASLSDIERRLKEIGTETMALIATATRDGKPDDFEDRMKALLDETTALKELRSTIENQRRSNDIVHNGIERAAEVMENASPNITEWDESTIRQLVDSVKVISKDKIEVCLHGGVKIEQDIIN